VVVDVAIQKEVSRWTMKDNLKHQQPQKAGALARPPLAKTAARGRSQPQPHLQVKAAGSSALKRLMSCMRAFH